MCSYNTHWTFHFTFPFLYKWKIYQYKQKTDKDIKHIQFSFLYISWWTYYLDISFQMCHKTMHTLIPVWFLANLVLSKMNFWDLSRNKWRETIKEDKMSSTLQSSAISISFHLLCLFLLSNTIQSILFFCLGVTLGLVMDMLRLWLYAMDTVQVVVDNLYNLSRHVFTQFKLCCCWAA